jgi:hypothetical protein
LLPASIPFRFFVSAAVFQVLAWLTLLLAGEAAIGFRGGPGPALAAVHLLTLGVLTSTAIGASVQLLPVATRRTLAAVWPIKLVFWLTVPGTAALVAAMYTGNPTAIAAAAAATVVGLVLFSGLLAHNLWRAGDLAVVAAYGWASLVALLVVAGLGVAVAVNYGTGVLPDHPSLALAHMIVGGFGFMGLLAMGFSHVLMPMFALAAAPPHRPSFVAFTLAVVGVTLAGGGAVAGSSPAITFAALIGLCATALHLRLMTNVLRSGMRKRLGLSFVLIRAAWALLPATLIVGLAALHGLAGSNGQTLFGFLLIAGWLLTFLLGVLQRILPFLASMHAGPSASGAPALMSELAALGPLKLHAACHGIAIAALVIAIAADMVWLARMGSAVGLVGALAFAWFTGEITWRVVAASRVRHSAAPPADLRG